METSLGILGFIFGMCGISYGLSAYTMVNELTKDVKNLHRQMEDIKQRLPPAQNF